MERTADRTGSTYAQVCRTADGQFQVEYRAGGPDLHFQAFTPDRRLAHGAVTGRAFDLPGWCGRLPWEPVDVG